MDGHPFPVGDAGGDVHNGLVTVVRQRLYGLIALPSAGQHTFEVDVPPGVTAYDFTFG